MLVLTGVSPVKTPLKLVWNVMHAFSCDDIACCDLCDDKAAVAMLVVGSIIEANACMIQLQKPLR